MYPEDHSYLLVLLSLSGAFCVIYLLRAGLRSSLLDICGPKSSSFWLGNEGDIKYQKEVGDVEFAWMKEFGSVWKTKGCMGEERLSIADPKALQHVLQTSGYRYPKTAEYRGNVRMVMGDGLVWAHAAQHQRQRKVMNQSFTVAQLQSFLPLFLRHSSKLAQKLETVIDGRERSHEMIVNVQTWLARATLDVIGEAGFDYQFRSLDNVRNPLSDMYDGLVRDSTLYPHKWDVLFRSFWKFCPPSPLWFVRYLPSRGYRQFRQYQDFIRAHGHSAIKDFEGEPKGNDVLSVLRRANHAEEGALQLSELEVVDQISTILLAGHDTSATSMAWWLFELSKHSEWQTRVREEIRAARQQVAQRGVNQFSISDLEGMIILQATMKEAMRLHPIVWQLPRVAGQDDILPLADPITTKSGNLVTSIPVRRGQVIDIRISAYNRNPAIWGADAGEWNPERFMDSDKNTVSLGSFSNLLNFSAGVRRCIGFRFALIEMQAMVSTLLEAFEFSLPPQIPENMVERKPSGIMLPMSIGHQGSWMGLHVKRAR
ncbi:cytochrome P450 [Peniophora sp. CONT]|nr:cytochrome P450 [Peniophora sp. CONT]